MSNDKLKQVLSMYETHFTKLKNENILVKSLKHCLEMIPKMRVFIEEGKIDKVNRWLGFIQGCLWIEKHYTIDRLREHNKEEFEKVIRNGNNIIICGMSKEKIDKQMKCKHENWHGPCIDEVSRYYKCMDCFCLKRDMSLEEYIMGGHSLI